MDYISGIAAHEQRFNAGLQLLYCFKNFPPIFLRHHHIKQQKLSLFLVLPEFIYGVFSVLCLYNLVAEFFKNISAQIFYGPVILCNGIGVYLMSISFLHFIQHIRIVPLLEGHDRRALEPVEDIFAE